MTQAGLFGFSNSGKTTLFNALTGLDALAAPHLFTTAEPNLGVVRVADPRLDTVAALEKSRKATDASFDLYDLPAVQAGSVRGLGPRREPDVLVVVLRGHDSGWVPVGDHGTDPVVQAEDLLVEMAVADHEVFDRRRVRIQKEASADPTLRPAAEAIDRAAERLAEGIPLRAHKWSERELRAFRDLAPLSLVPCLWVVNVAEDDPNYEPGLVRLREAVPSGEPVMAVSALLEEEVIRMDASERDEMYRELGLGKGAAQAVTRAVYDVLGLITFYTLSRRECRAWTIREGTSVRVAAGKVHSDLERGFHPGRGGTHR